jgi:hypothetical protein
VDDLVFVEHGRRVNGNARIVPAAVQIILKISSNISGEKIKPRWGAVLVWFSNVATAEGLRPRGASAYATGVTSGGGVVVSVWV